MFSCTLVALWGFWPVVSSITAGWVPVNRHVSLAKAAATLYGRTRQREIADTAERFSKGDPADILNWYAVWMVLQGVKVWGVKPPSTRRELVPAEHLPHRLHFRNGATELWEDYETHPAFINLSASRLDLFRLRKKLLSGAGGDV